MLDAIGWLIEQACRLADKQVCAIANLTDEADTESPRLT